MSIGRILYYLLWPAIWFYSPLVLRVRVCIVWNGKVLAVQNWFGSGNWTLPGGGVKLGETPQHAARREINEELHIDIPPEALQKLSDEAVVYTQNGLIKRHFFFMCTVDAQPQISTSHEISDYSWLTLDDLDLPQQIRQSLRNL